MNSCSGAVSTTISFSELEYKSKLFETRKKTRMNHHNQPFSPSRKMTGKYRTEENLQHFSNKQALNFVQKYQDVSSLQEVAKSEANTDEAIDKY